MATVLLSEDEPMVRRLVVNVLERQGHRVLSTSDGREALAVARAHDGAIDLVITDVVMPRLDGIELARAMRAIAPVRVLFISGYHELAHELSDEQLLSKPFTSQGLVLAVNRALSRAPEPSAVSETA